MATAPRHRSKRPAPDLQGKALYKPRREARPFATAGRQREGSTPGRAETLKLSGSVYASLA